MIQKILNYTFENTELLTMALTHSSYSKQNYERLEFLGDGILNFIVGEYFFVNTEEQEGQLTKLRAQFVSEAYLVKIFDRLNIENEVLVGKSYQGKLSASVKADMIEAIIAGVYLDSNFTKAKKFVLSMINLGNYKTMKNSDYKSQLQEMAQSKKQKVKYKLLSKEGKSNDPIFEVGVYLNNELLAKGNSNTKQKAEQEAARIAFTKLK